MKKILSTSAKILFGLILLIIIVLITVPIFFKEQIREKVEAVINESVNAKISFEDYKLGFFKNFPNLSFSLNELYVVGIDKFENDTLAGFKSFGLVFNLASLFGADGYEIKSIIIDKAVVNAILLEDGAANWDIMKNDNPTETVEKQSTDNSSLKIKLKKVELKKVSLTYNDYQSAMKAVANNLNFNLKGDMTLSVTNLKTDFTIDDVTFIMNEVKYLNKVAVDSKINLLANLDNMSFTFSENYLAINDLKLNFKGVAAMQGDDISTDVEFGTPQTSFKTIMSLVPAIYMTDYQNLKTSGDFDFSGHIKGIYSEKDSTLPNIAVNFAIKNGVIDYPDLPEKIQNINLNSNVFVDGKDMDNTILNIDLFHLELAGNPFDMNFNLRTPMSDPDFSGSLVGKIDLDALMRAVPMDSINLSGIIDMSVSMAGKMSMIEKAQYESFKATGKMNITNMLVDMIGYPDVKINSAGFEFTPAYASMNTNLNVGSKSDFALNGRLENYIPYILNNKTLKGRLSLNSKLVDFGEIMSELTTNTTAVNDTTALATIQIPQNIDFEFDALINDFLYNNIKAQQVKGRIIVRDGIFSIRETGMNILDGIIRMNADYDTRDTLKPTMKGDFDMRNIAIKDAFNTFNTVEKFVPMSKGIDGKVNATMQFLSLLGSDMMPVVQSINGSGKLQSEQITLLEAGTFDKIKGTLNLSDRYSNTFRDVNLSFRIADGRIFTTPFDIKTGNFKMNIGGDQGLDQTINYLIKTEIPRSDLGNSVNSLVENLSAQAASFGVAFNPADIIKVNFRVSGTFTNPVVAPVFGSESNEGLKDAAIQTVIQVVDQAKDKAREEVEAQAATLIQEAETQAQFIRSEAAKAAALIRTEAETQSQRIVSEAESRGAIARAAAQVSANAAKDAANKKADQLEQEADAQAAKLVDEAKKRSDELINKF